MKSPRILFIAPSSYPIFGAEANVNAKLLKILSEGGAEIDLVSRAIRKDRKAYPESTDDFYFSKLKSINVVKTDSKFDIKTIFRYLRTYLKFGFIYSGIDWAIDALPICEALIKRHKYDFLYTFNQPSELLGVYLTKKYNIPWVSTWNDPYVWMRYPKPYGFGPQSKISALREKLIKEIGKVCDFHIFPSERLMKYMQIYMPGITFGNSCICPHIMLSQSVHKKINGDKLKIIHSGALGRERNPIKFLNALKIFLEKEPEANIEISFLGVMERMDNSEIFEFVKSNNLMSCVSFIPPVSYKESIEILKEYDISMILEAECEEGIFLPSKVADYMQSGIPIFTLSPSNGVLKDLYNAGYIEYFADCSKVENIIIALNQIYNDFINDKIKHSESACNYFREEAVLNTHKTRIWDSPNI